MDPILTLGGVAWVFGAVWVAAVVLTVLRATAGFAQLPRLAEGTAEAGATGEPAPSVSVIVAARNEAEGVAEALGSVLGSDHPRLELVVVDDRSTDGTGPILEGLARRDGRVRLLRLRRLPAGWLGKNHALQRGAEVASGEWLLFTDADVRFAPEAIRLALAFARRRGLDHVTAVPALLAQGPGIRLYMVWMLLIFNIWHHPWEASRPDRRASAGLGAFNLVRRDAYWGVGGHAALPLALTDDVALGGLLKAAGYRQTLAIAAHVPGQRTPLLQLEWYPSLRAAIGGFEKNAFAMFHFRPAAVFGCAVFGIASAVIPPLGIALAPGWHRLPWIAGYLLTAGAVWYAGRTIVGRVPAAGALLFPAAQLALVWTVLRSAGLAMRRGGVRWRDTFYPLADLREADARLQAAGEPEPRLAVEAEGSLAPRR